MNSRRTFVKQSSILGAAIMVWPSFACKPVKQAIGLQLYTLKDVIYKDVKGTIEKVGQAGYTEVETFDFSTKTGFWGMSAAAFGTLLNKNGLAAVSGHYAADKMLKDGNMEDMKQYIECAVTLKSNYVTVPWMDEQYRRNADDYKRHAESFNKAGELCKAAGLMLGYHNHDFEFKKQGDTTGLEILLNETDKSLVAFEMDLYWVIRSGNNPLDLFAKYPGRFQMWHVKDMSPANKDLNTEIGKGTIDFKPIFAKAKTSGMKHFFVEQETNYKPDFVGSVQESAAFIKNKLI